MDEPVIAQDKKNAARPTILHHIANMILILKDVDYAWPDTYKGNDARFAGQAVTKILTSSSKFSRSYVLTLQTIPAKDSRNRLVD